MTIYLVAQSIWAFARLYLSMIWRTAGLALCFEMMCLLCEISGSLGNWDEDGCPYGC